MDFGEALHHLKKYKKVRRFNWEESYMKLDIKKEGIKKEGITKVELDSLVNNWDEDIDTDFFKNHVCETSFLLIQVDVETGEESEWYPKSEDILAEDWETTQVTCKLRLTKTEDV